MKSKKERESQATRGQTDRERIKLKETRGIKKERKKERRWRR